MHSDNTSKYYDLKKYCHLERDKKHANYLAIPQKCTVTEVLVIFFQAACRKSISIPDLFWNFLLMISKRFSRPMEPQYIPKLSSSNFSRSFCGVHGMFNFILPCCRDGWIKGWTKRSFFKISCFSLSCQWSYDHYPSVTSPYLFLKLFLPSALFCYF